MTKAICLHLPAKRTPFLECSLVFFEIHFYFLNGKFLMICRSQGVIDVRNAFLKKNITVNLAVQEWLYQNNLFKKLVWLTGK